MALSKRTKLLSLSLTFPLDHFCWFPTKCSNKIRYSGNIQDFSKEDMFKLFPKMTHCSYKRSDDFQSYMAAVVTCNHLTLLMTFVLTES